MPPALRTDASRPLKGQTTGAKNPHFGVDCRLFLGVSSTVRPFSRRSPTQSIHVPPMRFRASSCSFSIRASSRSISRVPPLKPRFADRALPSGDFGPGRTSGRSSKIPEKSGICDPSLEQVVLEGVFGRRTIDAFHDATVTPEKEVRAAGLRSSAPLSMQEETAWSDAPDKDKLRQWYGTVNPSSVSKVEVDSRAQNLV